MTKTVDEILTEWNKKTGSEVAHYGLRREELPSLPFSSATANYMTYGGIPRRRMIEFAGTEGSGKTTSALDIVANAQYIFKEEQAEALEDLQERLDAAVKGKKSAKVVNNLKDKLNRVREPKKCVYVDLENTLDREWAMSIGVDVENLAIITPEDDTAEEILQNVLDLIRSDEVGLLVIDSLPYLVPQQIYDKDLDQKSYGGISAVMADFCKKVGPLIKKTGCTVICINQMRDKINSQYPMLDTPGGRALKHAYAVRLMFRKGQFFDARGKLLTNSAPNPYGNIVEITVAKTKAFKPDRRMGTYTLSYSNGIDVEADLVDMAIIYGIIAQAGAWFSLIDEETGEIQEDSEGVPIKAQGKPVLVKMLRDNEELYDLIMEQVHERSVAS